jgi:serine/threonine-protein kinase
VKIKCTGSDWELGNLIHEGGFGKVYEASSDDGRECVAKLVPKEPGSEREMLFGEDISDARNVVPTIDQGETVDAYVLIMPRAERSLADEIASRGAMDAAAGLPILTDIATALADLDGRVVHRDLKPQNVLLLDGHWCLADFGISRYAEASTAPDTRKLARSSPYAAPEQWREERATSAVDVYALGIVAYELLTGSWPFPGPDFREQHLHGSPPALPDVGPRLAALIAQCIDKAPGGRPTPGGVLARLQRVTEDRHSAAAAALADVNRAEIDRLAEDSRAASVAQTEEDRRQELSHTALRTFTAISDPLFDMVQSAASAAEVQRKGTSWSATLRHARLDVWEVVPVRSSPWGGSLRPAFDVISSSAISLSFRPDRTGYEGRSHSLWYCDAQQADVYAWFETAFMTTGLVSSSRSQAPFGLGPGAEAGRALAPIMDVTQCAWPFTKLEDDGIDEFIDRWIAWFAIAAQGQLQHPTHMPERDPRGSYRQS